MVQEKAVRDVVLEEGETPDSGLSDTAKMSRAQLEALVKQLKGRVETAEARSPSPFKKWDSAKLPNGKYRVRIPRSATGTAISLNGVQYEGVHELPKSTILQLMEIFSRSIVVEQQRMQSRGNLERPELLSANDLTSRMGRNPLAVL